MDAQKVADLTKAINETNKEIQAAKAKRAELQKQLDAEVNPPTDSEGK